MIKECADIMRSSVSSKHLYRIGGDEFVIIYVDITEESFYDNVQLLKNAFEKSKMCIRGRCWERDPSGYWWHRQQRGWELSR